MKKIGPRKGRPKNLLCRSTTMPCAMITNMFSGGSKGGARNAPFRSKFFQFHAVFFEKLFKSYVCATPSPGELRPPPRGNPGSATDVRSQRSAGIDPGDSVGLGLSEKTRCWQIFWKTARFFLFHEGTLLGSVNYQENVNTAIGKACRA